MGEQGTNRAARVYVLGGGIGAGKSTLLDAFTDAGFVVIRADAVGHDALEATTVSGRQVMARWPEVVVDGAVDRSVLAGIVFNDPAALAELESFTHPRIQEVIQAEVAAVLADGAARGVVVEVPLIRVLTASDWAHIAVVAPEEVRVARAVARGADERDVRARIANQEPDEAWAEWADVIIDNGGSLDETLKMVADIIDGLSPLGSSGGRVVERELPELGDDA